jgi:hypothetical protein
MPVNVPRLSRLERLRGKPLDWVVFDRYGIRRRLYERLPVIGDRLFRARITREVFDNVKRRQA